MLDVGVLPSWQVIDVLDVLDVVSLDVVSLVDATPEEVSEEQKGQHVQLSEHPAIMVVAKHTTIKETIR